MKKVKNNFFKLLEATNAIILLTFIYYGLCMIYLWGYCKELNIDACQFNLSVFTLAYFSSYVGGLVFLIFIIGCFFRSQITQLLSTQIKTRWIFQLFLLIVFLSGFLSVGTYLFKCGISAAEQDINSNQEAIVHMEAGNKKSDLKLVYIRCIGDKYLFKNDSSPLSSTLVIPASQISSLEIIQNPNPK